MKRAAWLALALLGLFALSSCAPAPGGDHPDLVQVYVTEGEGFYVVDNGQWAEPDGAVTFHLSVAPDCRVTGADFGGSYTLTQQGAYTVLTAEGIRYPTRIGLYTEKLDPAARYLRTVTYQPNGGEGEPFSVTGSILDHTRLNTAQGGFDRAGHTLVGWNTAPDGSGVSVGLGSRVSVGEEGLTLYAQWAGWSDESHFRWEEGAEGVRITGYDGSDEPLVIPARLGGKAVTAIAAGAFRGCGARWVVLPPGLAAVEDGAFTDAALETLTLFDDIKTLGDGAFEGCGGLKTLRVNAATDPYGYAYRRESLLADKVDLLIGCRGEKKLVFYGGCSMWYNLIGSEAARVFDGAYRVVNLGLNGTVNSLVQMEIIGHYLEEGDIFFHAPELSSRQQLLTVTDMSDGDDKLWCGLEYNYDLFALVDIRGMEGVFDSLTHYLAKKKPGGSYNDQYRDANGVSFMDETGGIPFLRTQGQSRLDDEVVLDPERLADGLPALARQYRSYADKGARVYVSYACVDVDGLPEEQRDNVEPMDALFRRTVEEMDGPVLISALSDYLYTKSDFYDTHYHLLTQAAYRNTALWLRDLEAAMGADGLWP